MKQNGLQIIIRQMMILNIPCCIRQLVAQVGISGSNSLINNFEYKNEYGKKYIQSAVLRKRQQGEKRLFHLSFEYDRCGIHIDNIHRVLVCTFLILADRHQDLCEL